MDISGFMSWFVNAMVSIVSNLFGILDNISFWGVSLLGYFIGVLVLGAVLNVVLALVRSRSTRRSAKGSSGKGEESSDS